MSQPRPCTPLFLRAAAVAMLLSGCSLEIPDFLGREGTGASTYNFREEPAPDPVLLPLRSARAERGLNGVIVRAEGIAPTQGYYGGTLLPLETATPGLVAYTLVARPPTTQQSVGPERTRSLPVATFLTNRELRGISTIRVTGAGNTLTLSPP